MSTSTTINMASSAPSARFKDILQLTKPRLSLLVLFTTGAGLWLAPGAFAPLRAWATMFATAMMVGAANALNCYIERDIDALMKRTRQRPLPSGRLDAKTAFYVSLNLASLSALMLLLVANPLTAALSIIAFISYVWCYTPLKQHTPWAVVVGAVPGAIPPLMGWTAVTNSISAGGLSLFALLFCWQLPHFLAIALQLREDYQRAGLRVLAVTHGERATKIGTVLSLVVLLVVSLSPVWYGIAGVFYAIIAALAGGVFLGISLHGINSMPALQWAKRVFLASLAYLTVLLLALLLRAP